eukprot:scaffold27227_cov45-Attheya_sp.AAC.2
MLGPQQGEYPTHVQATTSATVGPPASGSSQLQSTRTRAQLIPNALSDNNAPPSQTSSGEDSLGFLNNGFMINSNARISHTPPSGGMATSYEAHHFGKRARAGSMSGRLRSASMTASDLESRGLIDQNQKGILKDLIVSGDDALQVALDQYEQGNASELESMIRNGKLMASSTAGIDLLDDLDLDFLNVNEGDFGELDPSTIAAPTAEPVPSSSSNVTMTNSIVTTRFIGGKVAPVPVLSSGGQHPSGGSIVSGDSGRNTPQASFGGSNQSSPAILPAVPTLRPPSYEYDGIGDLDFNEDDYNLVPGGPSVNANYPVGGGDAYSAQLGGISLQPIVPSGKMPRSNSLSNLEARSRSNSVAWGAFLSELNSNQQPPSNSNISSSTAGVPVKDRGMSITSQEAQRLRSNSLAWGALLNEPASDGRVGAQYGQWMIDSPSLGPIGGRPRGNSNIVVGANGELYIINNDNNMMYPVNNSAGQPKSTKDTSDQGTSQASLKKAQAAERRREKNEKKEQKERDRQDKKVKKEFDLRNKKERDAKEREEKKEQRAAVQKSRQQERKAKKSEDAKQTKADTIPMDEGEEEERKETPSGLGLPRSMSDPNLSMSMDANGLLHVDRPDGWVGAYSPDSRKIRIERFLAKRNHRVWTKKVKYDVRKNFADSRLRVKGRFVKKEDELLMRDLVSLS